MTSVQETARIKNQVSSLLAYMKNLAQILRFKLLQKKCGTTKGTYCKLRTAEVFHPSCQRKSQTKVVGRFYFRI